MNRKIHLWLALFGICASLLFLEDAFAQAPILRNSTSTNVQGTPIIGNLRWTNIVTGGWIQFDSGGLAVFSKDGVETGRIFGVATGGVAMAFGAQSSGLYTNATMVLHTRDGTANVLSLLGDFTSQTGLMIAAWTNSGTAQYVFTVNSGGTIYSRSLLSWKALYTDGNTNIVSATNTVITYAANTQTVNFASTPYQSFTVTNDTVLTNQNQQVGRAVAVLLTGNITNSNLSFPSGWQFLGAGAPSVMPSNKVAVLSLTAYGTDPTNVIAAIAFQP